MDLGGSAPLDGLAQHLAGRGEVAARPVGGAEIQQRGAQPGVAVGSVGRATRRQSGLLDQVVEQLHGLGGMTIVGEQPCDTPHQLAR